MANRCGRFRLFTVDHPRIIKRLEISFKGENYIGMKEQMLKPFPSLSTRWNIMEYNLFKKDVLNSVGRAILLNQCPEEIWQTKSFFRSMFSQGRSNFHCGLPLFFIVVAKRDWSVNKKLLLHERSFNFPWNPFRDFERTVQDRKELGHSVDWRIGAGILLFVHFFLCLHPFPSFLPTTSTCTFLLDKLNTENSLLLALIFPPFLGFTFF